MMRAREVQILRKGLSSPRRSSIVSVEEMGEKECFVDTLLASEAHVFM